MNAPRLLAKREFKVDVKAIGGLAWEDSALWVTDPVQELLVCVDRDTGGEIRRYPCPEVRGGLCGGDGVLWLLVGDEPRLRRVDPQTGALIDERLSGADVPASAKLAWDAGTLWIANASHRAIERLKPETDEVTARLEVTDPFVGIELAEEFLWYTVASPAQLVRLDKENAGRAARFAVDGSPIDLCFDGWLFWFADGNELRAVRP